MALPLALPVVLAGLRTVGLKVGTKLGLKTLMKRGAAELGRQAPRNAVRNLKGTIARESKQLGRLRARKEAAYKAGNMSEFKKLDHRWKNASSRKAAAHTKLDSALNDRAHRQAAHKLEQRAAHDLKEAGRLRAIAQPSAVSKTTAAAGASKTGLTWNRVKELAEKGQSPLLWGLTGASVASMFAGSGGDPSGPVATAGLSAPTPSSAGLAAGGRPWGPRETQALQQWQGLESAQVLQQLHNQGFYAFDPGLGVAAEQLGQPLSPMTTATLQCLFGAAILSLLVAAASAPEGELYANAG